jgi:hypothetical protein
MLWAKTFQVINVFKKMPHEKNSMILIPYLSYYVIYSLNLIHENHLLFSKKTFILIYLFLYFKSIFLKKIIFFCFKLFFS